MLENATRICQATFGVLSLREGAALRVVAMHNAPPAYAELRRREPTWMLTGPMGRLAAEAVAIRQSVQVPDLAAYGNDDPLDPRLLDDDGRAQHDSGAAVERRRIDRHIGDLSPGGAAVHRQAGGTLDEFCRPGGDRHRERAIAKRTAPAHRRFEQIAGKLARRAGSPGADREARLARPAHRRHRPRDQEPAQFRQ